MFTSRRELSDGEGRLRQIFKIRIINWPLIGCGSWKWRCCGQGLAWAMRKWCCFCARSVPGLSCECLQIHHVFQTWVLWDALPSRMSILFLEPPIQLSPWVAWVVRVFSCTIDAVRSPCHVTHGVCRLPWHLCHSKLCLCCCPFDAHLESLKPSGAFYGSWGASSTSHSQLPQRGLPELTVLSLPQPLLPGMVSKYEQSQLHAFRKPPSFPSSPLACSASQTS